jgi:hypothetical protein
MPHAVAQTDSPAKAAPLVTAAPALDGVAPPPHTAAPAATVPLELAAELLPVLLPPLALLRCRLMALARVPPSSLARGLALVTAAASMGGAVLRLDTVVLGATRPLVLALKYSVS